MVKDDDGECMGVCVWGVDEGTHETPSRSAHDSAEGIIENFSVMDGGGRGERSFPRGVELGGREG